jgi:signal transduction histidine kinase
MPGRFEWKILSAVLLVAVLSTGTAAYALSYALKGMLGFWQQEQQTPDPGTRAAEVFRAYFIDRKDEFRRRTRALAATRPTRMADLAGTDSLLRARLLEGETVVGEIWEAPPEVQARMREGTALPEPIPGTDSEQTLELTFGIPLEMYDRFIELTRAIDRQHQREQAFSATVAQYIRDYLVFVVGLLAVVCLAGLYFARRATQRLARLRDAAQRVGAGDLAVQLGPTGRDELDDVARAFDGMVRELGDARSRLEYLQKVSAWQEVARRLAHEIKNPLTPIQLAVQELAMKYKATTRLPPPAGHGGGDPARRDHLPAPAGGGLLRLRQAAQGRADAAGPGRAAGEFERLHPEWQPYIEVVQPPAPVTAPCDRCCSGGCWPTWSRTRCRRARERGPARPCACRSSPGPARRRAVLLVDDNGPGVPASDSQRIFDPT